MTKRFGFTLAEVLITLGIIGVVAAMTMPTLINQTRGAQYKTAFKKALSSISQAVTLNVALDDISFAEAVQGQEGVVTAVIGSPAGSMTVASILQSRMNGTVGAGSALQYDTIKGSITAQTVVPCSTTATASNYDAACNDQGLVAKTQTITADTFFMLNDGIIFGYDADNAFGCSQVASESGGTNKICYGIIDVNGAKGPNRLVACDNGTGGVAAADKATCTVSNPTDIYPVAFYDQTILPASDAARAVMYGK